MATAIDLQHHDKRCNWVYLEQIKKTSDGQKGWINLTKNVPILVGKSERWTNQSALFENLEKKMWWNRLLYGLLPSFISLVFNVIHCFEYFIWGANYAAKIGKIHHTGRIKKKINEINQVILNEKPEIRILTWFFSSWLIFFFQGWFEPISFLLLYIFKP